VFLNVSDEARPGYARYPAGVAFHCSPRSRVVGRPSLVSLGRSIDNVGKLQMATVQQARATRKLFGPISVVNRRLTRLPLIDPKPAVEPSCQRPLLVALSGSGRVCSGPIFDQAVHRGVYAQAGGRSLRNPLLASLANRDDCDRDTAGCRPGHKCRHMLRRRSRRALAEVIDSP
jgi:hypothetical protein